MPPKSLNGQHFETVIIGITLTPEQQEKTHGVRRHFVDRLASLNNEIDRLQAKLISLEMEKVRSPLL